MIDVFGAVCVTFGVVLSIAIPWANAIDRRQREEILGRDEAALPTAMLVRRHRGTK